MIKNGFCYVYLAKTITVITITVITVMFFEIGAAQADDVKKIAENNNLYAECIKDYSLNDRVIIVFK